MSIPPGPDPSLRPSRLRIGAAFAAAAAACVAVTAAPLVILAGTEQVTYAGLPLRSVLADLATLTQVYGVALGLTLLFGLPAWLVLRARRWGGAWVYSLAGAVIAGLVAIGALWGVPREGVVTGGAWAAMAGALGGLTFHAVAFRRLSAWRR